MEILTQYSFHYDDPPKYIRPAARGLVIKDGKVVEQGNHNELMKKREVYYNMYMSQFD